MENVIRILHVVTHMNRGGLETMIMNYYRNIDRSKIQFDFLTHRSKEEKKDYDNEIESLGGKIYHISRLNPFSYKYKKELRNFFKNHREYNIIHVHLDCMSGVVLKQAKKAGIRCRIAHCHSSNQDKNLFYPIKLIFKQLIPKYATDLFACGESSGKWMFGKNADFIVLKNAIDSKKYIYDCEKRSLARNELNIKENCLVVGLVARFSKVKNHIFLVDVFESLLQKHSNSLLVLVGQGECQENIKKIVKEKHIENNVIFLGLRSDVDFVLQALDFFVMPSLYEGLPLSVIEAQASGTKTFISDNVPQDCIVTDLVKQIKLSQSSEKWVDSILSEYPYNKENTKKDIEKNGFDITENALYLQRFYLEK